MKPIPFKLTRFLLQLSALISLMFVFSNSAFANLVEYMRTQLSCHTLDCGHWYVGGNIGVSHLHDNPNPGSGDSVDQNGPGWSVLGGYQFNSILGTELGYTQYHYSREHAGSAAIAQTEHYAVDLAATLRYPLINAWNALGKLGAAYSYARKEAVGGGPISQKSSGAGSLYWGLGLDYSFSPTIDVIGQFASARGNNSTGSTDLWSIGLNVALL